MNLFDCPSFSDDCWLDTLDPPAAAPSLTVLQQPLLFAADHAVARPVVLVPVGDFDYLVNLDFDFDSSVSLAGGDADGGGVPMARAHVDSSARPSSVGLDSGRPRPGSTRFALLVLASLFFVSVATLLYVMTKFPELEP